MVQSLFEETSHFINGRQLFPVPDVMWRLKNSNTRRREGLHMSVMDFIAIVSLLVGVFALGYMFGSKK